MISVNPKRIKSPELVTKGLLLHQAGDFAAAMDAYAAVLKKHPRHAVAYYLMGLLFEAVNDQRRAVDLLSKAISIKPDFCEAWYNRGVVYQWLGKIPEARRDYERSIKLNPRFGASYINLGNVLMAQGKHDEAIRAYDMGGALRPDSPEGQHNRSFVHLLRGEWAQGWEDYECRWQLPGHAAANPMPPNVPRWKGEPLEGKTLLVIHEQGAGDTLMMLRYVAGLTFQGARVILRVPAGLLRLTRLNFPMCDVDLAFVRGPGGDEIAPWPPCDYAIPFMSLPKLFGTLPDTVPFRDAPYLVGPLEGPEVKLSGGFRVGFAWKGSSAHKNDRNRSTTLAQWLPLLKTPGVAWYSLQQEMTEPEKLLLRQTPHVHCLTGMRDWADTANVLAKLEAVLSVDTGLIHLSGAMGVPTVALISALPDFRWQLSRQDTAWYQNVRLIRQPTVGDWGSVLRCAEAWVGNAKKIIMGEAA